MATMTMTSTTHETWGLLTLDGELDLSTSPELSEALLALGTDHARIAIDLRSVTFMDSTALGVIVAAMKRARERGGELALVGPSGSPRKVLSITALDQIVPIVDDPDGLAGIAWVVRAAQDPYALSVPADPAGLSTVRVFLRAIARTVDAEPERGDDLELIVSEICAALVEGGSGHLDIEVRVDGSAVSVAVDADGAPSAPEDNGIRGDLLGTLAPDLTWVDHGARFTAPVASGDDAAQAR